VFTYIRIEKNSNIVQFYYRIARKEKGSSEAAAECRRFCLLDYERKKYERLG